MSGAAGHPLTSENSAESHTFPTGSGAALAGLEARVREELDLLAYPSKPWVVPRRPVGGKHVYDVVIAGAGQGGLATAFGLFRERVDNILVIDEKPPGQEGPWLTYARMRTLRTPKHLTGPDLGIPSLTFRSWCDARHGPGTWERLERIPREMWAEYLAWFRRVLALPVRNGVRLQRIVPEADPARPGAHVFRLELRSSGGRDVCYARRVVLATGIEGSGAWHIPEFIRSQIPRRLYAHTSEYIDFERLAGRSVGVLGAGASAFDNAATALECGAREVHLFFRRRALPRVNPYRWMEFTGFLKHFADLDDAVRWRMMNHIFSINQPPPQDTFERATRFPNFRIHPGCPWTGAAVDSDRVRVLTPNGAHTFDFLIIGTGFVVDLAARPELAPFASEIALWSDRYRPEAGEENPSLASYPYLGGHLEFTEKQPGRAPYLKHIFNFTFGATVSMGLGGASISGMKYGVARLVAGITRSLFLEDGEDYCRSLLEYDQPELQAEAGPVEECAAGEVNGVGSAHDPRVGYVPRLSGGGHGG